MTCEGQPYLGVAIGTDTFAKEFIAEKVKSGLLRFFCWLKLLRVSHMPPI